MDKEGENVIVCGIALGLAVLGWAVSRKWGRKDWQKGAAVIAAAACLGLLSGYMELQTDIATSITAPRQEIRRPENKSPPTWIPLVFHKVIRVSISDTL